MKCQEHNRLHSLCSAVVLASVLWIFSLVSQVNISRAVFQQLVFASFPSQLAELAAFDSWECCGPGGHPPCLYAAWTCPYSNQRQRQKQEKRLDLMTILWWPFSPETKKRHLNGFLSAHQYCMLTGVHCYSRPAWTSGLMSCLWPSDKGRKVTLPHQTSALRL